MFKDTYFSLELFNKKIELHGFPAFLVICSLVGLIAVLVKWAV